MVDSATSTKLESFHRRNRTNRRDLRTLYHEVRRKTPLTIRNWDLWLVRRGPGVGEGNQEGGNGHPHRAAGHEDERKRQTGTRDGSRPARSLPGYGIIRGNAKNHERRRAKHSMFGKQAGKLRVGVTGHPDVLPPRLASHSGAN